MLLAKALRSVHKSAVFRTMRLSFLARRLEEFVG
jgi:hypothetical protein